MRIKILLALAFLNFTFVVSAHSKELASQALTRGEDMVPLASRASFEELRGAGDCKVQVLSQVVTRQPDPEKIPLIGYGKTFEEAQARAALVCVKWKCETLPQEISTTIDSWKNMPAEKLMDHFNATGHLEKFPAELRANLIDGMTVKKVEVTFYCH